MDNFVCPDLESFELFTPNWLDFEYTNMKDILFVIEAKPEYTE